MKIIFILLVSFGVTFGQGGAAIDICNSSLKQIVSSKSLEYYSKEKCYIKLGQYGITDFLQGQQDKVMNYIKSYYYVNDEKMNKALQAFLDDSFKKVDGYTNPDYLDEEKYHSIKNNIILTYTPKENYQLDIFISCLSK